MDASPPMSLLDDLSTYDVPAFLDQVDMLVIHPSFQEHKPDGSSRRPLCWLVTSSSGKL